MITNEVYVLSAVRTPIGKFCGALRDIPATELGGIAIRESVRRANIRPEAVDEVLFGNVLPGLGQHPARQAMLYAGIPVEKTANLVGKVCGSGFETIIKAAQMIKSGDREVVVACGAENMSRAPFLLSNPRSARKYGDDSVAAYMKNYGDANLVDSLRLEGLTDASTGFPMYKMGDIVAEKYKLSREAIDEFAFESHRRAFNAAGKGLFKEETVPVQTRDGSHLSMDEGIRYDTTLEKMADLKALEGCSRTTAGNSSTINDGSSSLVLCSREKAKYLNPIAKVIGYYEVGAPSEMVMEAPVSAVKGLIKKYHLNSKDMLMQHVEAFASASVVVRGSLGIDEKRFNPKGGAVSYGHPLGASGGINSTTLIYGMKSLGYNRGIVTGCVGGGEGVALAFELC
jgi:acetyl-CoA C-acetyltransferase